MKHNLSCMTIKELIKHLQTYPDHLEVCSLTNEGDPEEFSANFIEPSYIHRRTIFVHRITHFTEEEIAEPLRTIEVVIIDDTPDCHAKEGINVAQCIEQLRAYPPTHEVVIGNSYYELDRPGVNHCLMWAKKKGNHTSWFSIPA